MTLLNTVCNLGGNWPATLALWAGKNSPSLSGAIICRQLYNYLNGCHALINIIFS